MKKTKGRAWRGRKNSRFWAIVSDTGGEDRIRDAAVAIIRGTRRDAARYAKALQETFGEAAYVVGAYGTGIEVWSPARALAILAEDARNDPSREGR